MDKNLKSSDPALQPGKLYYNHVDGRADTIPDLTIQQFFIASATPPKAVFNDLILRHRVRNKNDGNYYQPDYGTPEYKAMVIAMAKAEADYRMEFAKAVIEKLNSREKEQ